MDEQKKQKTTKIVNIVVNVVVTIILVIALLVTINNISSKQKGYTSLFGTAYMVVQSSSMDPNGDYAKDHPIDYEANDWVPGFAKDDLVKVKILSDEEKFELKEGDIISFFVRAYENGEEVRIINSHRIIHVEPKYDDKGNIIDMAFDTQGDNNKDPDNSYTVTAKKSPSEYFYVIGKVEGKAGGFGKIISFFNSSTGFLVCIVIPSFLVVIYFAFNLVREILKMKKIGAANNKAKYEEELIAKLRAQGVQIPADMEESIKTDRDAPQPEQASESEAIAESENK